MTMTAVSSGGTCRFRALRSAVGPHRSPATPFRRVPAQFNHCPIHSVDVTVIVQVICRCPGTTNHEHISPQRHFHRKDSPNGKFLLPNIRWGEFFGKIPAVGVLLVHASGKNCIAVNISPGH